MFADVVESVRLIEQNEAGGLRRIRDLLAKLGDAVVNEHSGVLIERRGDGLLATFASPREACACANRLHSLAFAQAAAIAKDAPMMLRIGIHYGQLFADGHSFYGRIVNQAARIAAFAQPRQTVVSSEVRDRLVSDLDGRIVDLGDCFLKHVDEPLRLYRVEQASSIGALRAESADAPKEPAATSAFPQTTLAVLPPRGLGTLSNAFNCGDVVVDQWTTLFSQSQFLNVISRQSCDVFRGRPENFVIAAKRLRADYLVDSEFAGSGAAQEVRVALRRAPNFQIVWEDAFKVSNRGSVSLESECVSGVVNAVVRAMHATEEIVARGRPLPNLPAHTLYLAAVSSLHRFSTAEFARSREMLEALAERAPRHPWPNAWLARWHVFNVVQGWSSDPMLDGERALSHANRALEQDENSSLALAMAGSVMAGVKRDMAVATEYYDRSIAANPNEPIAWVLKGVAHGFSGDASSALTASQRALNLTPLNPMRFYYDSLASAAAMGARQFDRAIFLANQAIEANCMHGSAYRTLAIAQAMTGQHQAAQSTVHRLLAIEPGSSVAQFRARSAVASAQNNEFALALQSAGLPLGNEYSRIH